MPLDSIPGIVKVVNKSHTLSTLWTKYEKWESEGPRMFSKRAVQRQNGHLRASASVEVPDSCTMLHLSNEDRDGYALRVSDILIRDDYLKSLCDICHFATHHRLPPPDDALDGPIQFHNPFVDHEGKSTEASVVLLGHPGIGM